MTPYIMYGTYADMAVLDADGKQNDDDRLDAFSSGMTAYITQYIPSAKDTQYVLLSGVTFMDYKKTGNTDNAFCAFVPRLPRIYIAYSATSQLGAIMVKGYAGYANDAAQAADEEADDASRLHSFERGMETSSWNVLPGSIYALFDHGGTQDPLHRKFDHSGTKDPHGKSIDSVPALNCYCDAVTTLTPSRTYLAFGAPL